MCEFVCVCVYLLCVYVYICIYFRYNHHYNYMQKISRTYSTVFNLVKPDDVRPPQSWKKWYLWINWIFHNKTWIIVKNGEKKSLILRKFVSKPLYCSLTSNRWQKKSLTPRSCQRTFPYRPIFVYNSAKVQDEALRSPTRVRAVIELSFWDVYNSTAILQLLKIFPHL